MYIYIFDFLLTWDYKGWVTFLSWHTRVPFFLDNLKYFYLFFCSIIHSAVCLFFCALSPAVSLCLRLYSCDAFHMQQELFSFPSSSFVARL